MSLALSIFIVAAILFGLSVPLVQGRVAPNSLYGFRTAKTMSEPSVWYSANRFAGQATIAASAVMLVLAGVLVALDRYGQVGQGSLIALGLTFLIAPLLILILVLFLYHRSL